MLRKLFSLKDKVAVITGGAGMLGVKHAEAIAEMGGTPILFDLDVERVTVCAKKIADVYQVPAMGFSVDITQEKQISQTLEKVLRIFNRLDILINNAANNPKMDSHAELEFSNTRLEVFPLEMWEQDLRVGLTGSFLCSKIIGSEIAKRDGGVILNIASDLALIGPDQRIYRRENLSEDRQPVKPITYSVVKSGLLGLTRYLATYWAEKKVRVNALCPGGVRAAQDAEFVDRISKLIPLSRMAHEDEYKAAVVFLVSDASSYMTGSILSIDGGRTAW